MEKLYGAAIAFRPDYPSTPANDAWIAFRNARPYPYQAISAKKLQDGSWRRHYFGGHRLVYPRAIFDRPFG